MTRPDAATIASLLQTMPLRTVLRTCGVRQDALAKRLRVTPQRVHQVLSSPAWARKNGRKLAERVYRAAAKALGLTLADIREWGTIFPEEET